MTSLDPRRARRRAASATAALISILSTGLSAAQTPETQSPSLPTPEQTDAAAAAGRAMRPIESAKAGSAWSTGVSEENRRAAREQFQEGNALLSNSAFAQAAVKYRQALQLWDHPAAHYNLALALINLDQPIEVREHLLASLKHGPAPLDDEKFRHASSFLKLLEQQLAPVNIECNAPGAIVTLNEKILFTAPGAYHGYVRAGEYVIRATKPGFEPTEMRRPLLGGGETKIQLRLYTSEQLTETHRRWPTWVPFAVTGGGVLAAGVGTALLLSANSKFRELDHLTAERCSEATTTGPGATPAGCSTTGEMNDLRESGQSHRTAGVITTAAGGAIIGAGAVLFVMNMAVSKRISPEEYEKLRVHPALSRDFAGLTASARF
ncbi:MAG TPA: hypothetical protein VFQ61_02020 [Polyangiaceae bacterium]|nr:hypothetical protein [Polyangiaceae bacterium]